MDINFSYYFDIFHNNHIFLFAKIHLYFSFVNILIQNLQTFEGDITSVHELLKLAKFKKPNLTDLTRSDLSKLGIKKFATAGRHKVHFLMNVFGLGF